MKLLLDSRQLIIYLFIIVAIVIVAASLLFSHKLVRDLAQEERNKIEIWAEATRLIASESDNSDVSLILHILQSNTTIPVVLHDVSLDTYVANNVKLPSQNQDAFLKSKVESFASKHDPIVLHELNQYLYYDDSYTLKQLSIYPYIQLSVMFVFIIMAFFALSSSLKAEQNRVWMGLSKETAHQLGTPISSLVAWIELLKLKGVEPELLSEIDKDMKRLEMIAERFSKIGSSADLTQSDLRGVVNNALSYMHRRISNRVVFETKFPDTELLVDTNEPLFEWVIENLVKNATDAMLGQGVIMFTLFEKDNKVILDIKDTGKGIAKSKYKRIFSPGYSTKARGWGLGLSLAKRIVEDYHQGRIFVKGSEIGQGTTVRIVVDSSKAHRSISKI